MKRSLLFAAGIALLSITTSCDKCATCTYNDPEKGQLTNEVCSNGHSYTTAIEVHEDNGWSCAN
ncbi:MAG: hypothetical protein ACPGRC_07100 [Salibacteraceae bacterium]